ncbi:hypothetical protein QYE76_009585 [Lolium multiflorum]|uniref:Uncharacterized protein n=1 Tax=Lolium multiflorum TaxID=4521 RepID=A0AAD8TVA2_LOLMU|nr:hypothetical protein QYE76_009585 [Lolium multiflorum]
MRCGAFLTTLWPEDADIILKIHVQEDTVIGLDGKSAWWPKSACYHDLEWQICSADNLAIGFCPTSLRGHGLILIQLAGKTTITFSSNLLPLQASSTAEQATSHQGKSVNSEATCCNYGQLLSNILWSLLITCYHLQDVVATYTDLCPRLRMQRTTYMIHGSQFERAKSLGYAGLFQRM